MIKELNPFSIRTLIVQPGAFSTNMIAAVVPASQQTPAYNSTPLGQFLAHFTISPEERTFKAGSDVNKGCQGIFEVVTATGRGEGKEHHLKLVLRADNAERMLKRSEGILGDREAFREIWENTGHDGGESKGVSVGK